MSVSDPLPESAGRQIQTGASGAQGRGPLPAGPEDESFPPPPPMRVGGSADNSLNDSNSTTQSNIASECSEAECDREPLVKDPSRGEEESVPAVASLTAAVVVAMHTTTRC